MTKMNAGFAMKILLFVGMLLGMTAGQIVELTTRTFDSSIRDGNVWLVEFYAPWCRHCKNFEPTYQTISNTLSEWNGRKGSTKNIKVGRVDGSSERAIASRFNIRGFPTFYVIDGWSVFEYSGTRSHDAMVAFVTKSYKNSSPIPFMASPLGPMGQIQAFFLWVGNIAMSMFEWLQSKGLSDIFAGFLVVSVSVSTGLFSIILVGLFALKPKED
mmetsp:Transcript_18113/g.27623  ORF Transcript_18113/g.27623 Transcript_18113/m.27623 type:complete len:214 (-) Transcript_18113:259-900(-)|eukprot:CAMPEP_0118688970 /NCGR_PEP_ID=MMETSP0800-20121206/9213_1 /TAXON_ID=210618 ORGANISM="Striatella unipunctata, Strain CCMP2910" /NCGR_SAMPLE_ID=MMETSP0800 /ASSEMBLY_ACC=CAM_ASM_000638 /LENGTH=213 /DNA_ID=CAMNT_0006586283 /DNA_START=182 /DNA_END=823 /DNA_ORIENTATION=-